MERTGSWLQGTDISRVDLGLPAEEALGRAPEFLAQLRVAQIGIGQSVDDVTIDLLGACCRLIGESDGVLAEPLEDAENLFRYIQAARWPDPDFGERQEVLADCAFQAWRRARRVAAVPDVNRWSDRFAASCAGGSQDALGPLSTQLHEFSVDPDSRRSCDRTDDTAEGMTGELLPFPKLGTSISPAAARQAAGVFRSIPPQDRSAKPEKFGLDQSETLLCLCQLLERKLESVPADVLRDASFLYAFVESSPDGLVNFLFDEREYYLGEFAYLNGCASRVLSRREDSKEWLDRAEAWFLLTSNALADVARVNYQRLALKVEERRFEDVLRLVPALTETFRRLNARELLLKSQFVQGQVLKETNQFEAARRLFVEISIGAEEQGNERLLALALSDLSQLHAALGEADEALRFAKRASPVLKRLDNRVGLAKLNWGLANLFRAQNRLQDAICGYREAQTEFAAIEMRADVAAIQLVIADLLLELGQEAQAEWEIRAALPVIDELKMVPEGVAALSLLRESVRRRKIDRQALRDLHGYFDEIQG